MHADIQPAMALVIAIGNFSNGCVNETLSGDPWITCAVLPVYLRIRYDAFKTASEAEMTELKSDENKQDTIKVGIHLIG